MVVSAGGNVSDVKPVQPQKALPPMVVNAGGKFSEDRPVQL